MAAAKLMFVLVSAVSALMIAGVEDEAANPDPLTSTEVAQLLPR